MHALAPLDGLATLTDDTLRALRATLVSAPYDHDVLTDGERIAPGLFDALRLPLVHHAWRDDPSPARGLALLFTYAGVLPEPRARAILGGETLDALLRAGLLRRDDDGVRSAVLLIPLFGLYVISDPLHLGADAVMGPGPTTLDLCAVIPSPAPASVLDVGCGAGTLALLAAARGAKRVLGVDISPRAVALARLNARFNGLDVTFAESDLTAAARGERFDLIVSQPAFIARPPDVDAATFAHSGPVGDELAMRLLGELEAVTAPGGRALVLVQSAVQASPLHKRVRAALGEARSGVLLLTAPTLTPDMYALGYASLLDPSFGPRWRDITLRYRAHLRAMGIEEFSHALVCVCAEPLGYTMLLPVNGLRGFNAAALDLHLAGLRLASSKDDAVLRAAVRGHPGARWIEERDRPDSSMEPRWKARFHGVPFPDRGLGEATWVLLGLLDGADAIVDAVARYAEVCGAAPQEVRTQVLDFVRDSLARGLLVPFEP